MKMFAVSKTVTMVAKKANAVPVRNFFGLFMNKGEQIVGDVDQQSGRRKLEMDKAAQGVVAFNRDPLVPHAAQGTAENPIMVPSGFHMRTVGFENPVNHQMEWFNLEEGTIAYIKQIGLHFKIDKINDPADAHHDDHHH